jgi:hypothetical protein
VNISRVEVPSAAVTPYLLLQAACYGWLRQPVIQDIRELAAFLAAVLPQALERFLQGRVATPVDRTPPHLRPKWLTTLLKPGGG